MKKEELLKKRIISDKKMLLNRQLELISQDQGYRSDGIEVLTHIEMHKSLSALFLNNNLSKTKQIFHTIGKLTEILVNEYDFNILEWSNVHKCSILLSDNESLIKRFSNLSNTSFINTKKDIGVVTNAIQNSIKNNEKALKEDILVLERMEQKSKGEEKRYYEMSKLFFTAYLNNDKEALEKVLKDSLAYKTKNTKKYSGLVSQFIAIPEIGYAKLAWRKGLEVELNNPLVPKELLPVVPNSKYTDSYDFLINY